MFEPVNGYIVCEVVCEATKQGSKIKLYGLKEDFVESTKRPKRKPEFLVVRVLKDASDSLEGKMALVEGQLVRTAYIPKGGGVEEVSIVSRSAVILVYDEEKA